MACRDGVFYIPKQDVSNMNASQWNIYFSDKRKILVFLLLFILLILTIISEMFRI
jgi:hypothetical protein